MWPGLHPIYTTADGVVIYVSKGGKSQYNFKVRYQEPGKRVRTPKHIHLIIDLYMKRTGHKSLTMQLVDHIINEIILKIGPSKANPPVLQIFSPQHVAMFRALDAYVEYSVEFLSEPVSKALDPREKEALDRGPHPALSPRGGF
ncbi:MAG: hypothetical protein QW570_08250 [Candidatus Caldarchaeum sp.]